MYTPSTLGSSRSRTGANSTNSAPNDSGKPVEPVSSALPLRAASCRVLHDVEGSSAPHHKINKVWFQDLVALRSYEAQLPHGAPRGTVIDLASLQDRIAFSPTTTPPKPTPTSSAKPTSPSWKNTCARSRPRLRRGCGLPMCRFLVGSSLWGRLG